MKEIPEEDHLKNLLCESQEIWGIWYIQFHLLKFKWQEMALLGVLMME